MRALSRYFAGPFAGKLICLSFCLIYFRTHQSSELGEPDDTYIVVLKSTCDACCLSISCRISPLSRALRECAGPKMGHFVFLLLTFSVLVVFSSAQPTANNNNKNNKNNNTKPKTNMPHGKGAVARFLSGANAGRLEKLAGKASCTST